MSNNLIYSSETGTTTVEPVIKVQHTVSRTRVNDRTYGIKAGAAKRREKQERVQFFIQRKEALTRQRDAARARLADLQGQIRKIMTSCENGQVSDVDKALATLARMGKKEKALFDEITRLNDKINA